jgi:putative flippase GtrA
MAAARRAVLGERAQGVKQFARYLAVGIANTLFGYVLIFGFMFVAGWSPEASNVAGYSIGLITSYLLNRSITFRSINQRGSEFLRFVAVFLISFGANFAALWVMLHVLGVEDWIAQIVAGFFYVGMSYLLNRAFVFSNATAGRASRS